MKAPKSRMTSQRRVILQELKKSKSHPTADELYARTRKKLPKISLGTVYRNLDKLAESGEILRLHMCGSQKRYDGNTHPHYHIRCSSCGRVDDVEVDFVPPDLTTCSADSYQVTGFHFEIQGLCENCRAKE
ncbi:MAG: Fur family transcriptional regulator [Desulfovibrionales bacterium]